MLLISVSVFCITCYHKYMDKKTKYIGFKIYVEKLFGNRAIDKREGSEEATPHKNKECEGSNANFLADTLLTFLLAEKD